MRSIPSFDGYWAGADGRIHSDRSGSLIELTSRDRDGYRVITLKANGRRERHQVHRLVLMAYAGVPAAGLQCRHLNGVRSDNRPSNLAWGSAEQNAADAIRHGSLGPGMKARHRRLTPAQVMEVRRRRAAGESKQALAAEFDIHPEYIPRLMNGRAWRCLPMDGEGEGESSQPLAA